MKKSLLLFVAMVTGMVANAQYENAKQVFNSPKLQEAVKTHKLVAILPFEVKMTYKKQPRDFDLETNREKEREKAYSIQSSIYTFLLRKASKYTVEFQDVEKTNVLLKKAGMTDKLGEFTKDEIAKALNVDAVIAGKFEAEQSKSEAGAIVTTVLFGGMGSKTGSGALTMMVNDGPSGDLLWRFFKSMNDDVFSSSDELIDRMMRKVSRNFPYTK
ncbi:hypothetical protein SAMN05421820_107420 [Pedobacter steynii]|uniref:DUF4136 domain-containing protein n=1 Tax=Pedobacter steynii TaxID=430522 RepID=A0A1H0BIE2_9SPHI|nr:hypothetical protein [Pedobacter steynii]NQX41046.1 hypothetical protein [Pedobacter steynii]SDN45371.1 hypothetical protein SAMN05421820_107420 [Pedobacter steynii]